ncbi:MAG: hypothetical protein IK092_07395 [Muribaculaceae bacterium]|nr:hypothetical protein [Muribaculaceae bacterium]
MTVWPHSAAHRRRWAVTPPMQERGHRGRMMQRGALPSSPMDCYPTFSGTRRLRAWDGAWCAAIISDGLISKKMLIFAA